MSLILLGFTSCTNKKDNTINLRLKWAYQAQFAGYLVASEKGFYKEEGLTVNILPAGPDLKPYSTVASGSDDIGIGIISQVITARSNGVPLVAISQIFQDSPNRFVLKSENRIDSLQQLRGKPVGLWLGGDEIELISMLKSVGMTLNDITVIPQKFSVAPFLQNEYVCSQVMVYNELNQIKNEGYEGDKLQIISPKDYNSAILGDLIFTSEKYLSTHSEQLNKFLIATYRGWKYTYENPDEAIDIVLKFNPELNREEQKQQLMAVLSLINTGNTPTQGLGYINVPDYENAKSILLGGLDPSTEDYKKIEKVNISECFSSDIWNKIPIENKKLIE